MPAPSAALLLEANQQETDTWKIPAKSYNQTRAGFELHEE